MPYSLISLAEAKQQLNIKDDDTSQDNYVQRKAERASALIVDYLKTDATTLASWLDESVEVPGPVMEAVEVLLTHLHENRGDDMKADVGVWDAIQRMLMRLRDPAIA